MNFRCHLGRLEWAKIPNVLDKKENCVWYYFLLDNYNYSDFPLYTSNTSIFNKRNFFFSIFNRLFHYSRPYFIITEFVLLSAHVLILDKQTSGTFFFFLDKWLFVPLIFHLFFLIFEKYLVSWWNFRFANELIPCHIL